MRTATASTTSSFPVPGKLVSFRVNDNVTPGTWTLAIERSTRPPSLALFRGTICVCDRAFSPASAGAATWVREVSEVLSEAGVRTTDLGRLAVGLGPGSFAGIRSAIAFLQGLALPREIPLVGVSSAAALAYGLALPAAAQTVAVVGDARRGRLWCAVYRVRAGAAKTRPVIALERAPDQPPAHDASDFALVAPEDLSECVPATAEWVTPDSLTLDRVLTVRTPTARQVGALVLAEPSAARCDPVPIYLHPAVAAPTATA